MKYILLLSIFLPLLCLTSAKVRYRLQTNVKPSFYTIKIHPDLDDKVFRGEVTIHVTVENLVESIAFHSSNLDITSFHLNAEKLNFENGTDFAYTFSDHQLIEIYRLNGGLVSPGDYNIHIIYKGNFSEGETGLFQAKYNRYVDVPCYLIITDFQPTYAREVFPCFDEPVFKAKFQLSVVVPNNTYRAISNMRAVDIFKTSYGVVYDFETTKPMSSYLLAFGITNSDYSSEEYIYDDLTIRVNSYLLIDPKVADYINQAIKFYTNYTNYSNPLHKIDIIDYYRTETAGTENWGFITIDTDALSNDSISYSNDAKIYLISHEVAHFWFGNLVTNNWWDDIWLQEGFAVYMGLKAEECIAGNAATERLSYDEVERHIYKGEQQKSQPVVNFAETPTSIRENFNHMSYTKGAAVLQMVEIVLGEQNFQNAIRKYISEYAFKTATTDDFLDILEDFAPSDIDLRGFVYGYLYQTKFPIIQVIEDENNFILTQLDYLRRKIDEAGSKWTIPINYVTSLTRHQMHQPLVWYNKKMEHLKIPKGNETCIKLNHKGKFLYRTVYSPRSWHRCMTYVEEMDSSNRDHFFREVTYVLDYLI